jgi:hypothetical protein
MFDALFFVVIAVVFTAFGTGAILGILYELTTYRRSMKQAVARMDGTRTTLEDRYRMQVKHLETVDDRLQVVEMLNKTTLR